MRKGRDDGNAKSEVGESKDLMRSAKETDSCPSTNLLVATYYCAKSLDDTMQIHRSPVPYSFAEPHNRPARLLGDKCLILMTIIQHPRCPPPPDHRLDGPFVLRQ